MKEKILVLGGGMAGLTAAYELSKTQDLRDRYEVAVYQMGWRLGGKASSGRGPYGRIQEHGLHFWFGCYENAFRLLKEVYATRPRRADDPLTDWKSALKPHAYTPVGVLFNGEPAYWPINWPIFPGEPGDGRLPSLPDLVETFRGFLVDVARHGIELGDFIVRGNPMPGAALGLAGAQAGGLGNLKNDLRRVLADAENFAQAELETLPGMIEPMQNTLRSVGPAATTHPFYECLVLGYAFIKGVLIDVLGARELWRLEDVDFREWLILHGADRSIVKGSTLVRALYDLCLQYEDGDPNRPNFAAGAAIVVFLRLLCTTKGAFIWSMQAGMGEAVVAPLYEVLLQNGVQFHFFRKIKRLVLSADKRSVQSVLVAVQAKSTRDPYGPTFLVNGLKCWPAEPLWNQLVDGEQIKQAAVNFESHWCSWPVAGEETLERGTHFDKVVLALSLGGLKQLNPADASIAEELTAVNPDFRKMTEQIGLIPTQAFQIWCDPDLRGLGWQPDPPATVAAPEPHSVWADMSHTMRYEPWPEPKPQTVEYFCGVLGTDLFTKPSTELGVPQTASNEVKRQAIAYLQQYAYTFFPQLGSRNGVVRWSLLHDYTGANGPARFEQQFWRANVSPNECIPGSGKGATRCRLRAGASGFENLYLAGCWVRTGLNNTCIEGAVMAGKQAARAISGSPQEIPGENFLREYGALGGGE